MIRRDQRADHMGRICISIPDNLEGIISKESEQKAITKSEWITHICEQFLSTRDQIPDQGCDQVRQDLHGLRVTAGILEERVRGQDLIIEELRKSKSFLEGQVHTLMAERQVLIPEKARGFWDRLFGR
jgi:hypothetical protein